MAPLAAQIVYEGPNTTAGVNNTYNRIVVDNKSQVMSTSWGLCEAQSGTAELQTLDAIFKQGAAQGIAMYAAQAIRAPLTATIPTWQSIRQRRSLYYRSWWHKSANQQRHLRQRVGVEQSV